MSAEIPDEVSEISTVIELDGGAYAAVTGLEYVDAEVETPVGNVLRRTCPVIGGQACAQTCQLSALRGEAPEAAIGPDTRAHIEALDLGPEGLDSYFPPECADDNLAYALDQFGIRRNEALIVGVTSGPDRIGFLDDPDVQANIAANPSGWSEIPGYNAFFARRTDTLPVAEGESTPVRLLGARLADSGFVVAGMVDRRGNRVEGIIHSTRTNMPGREYRKEYGGVRQSFMHYVLSEAMARYGADPSSVYVQMVAAVGPESWRKRYPNRSVMHDNLPGWEDEGLIRNMTNPGWRPGMEVLNPATEEYDVLWPQYPHKVRMEIIEAAARLGIQDVRLDASIDPGQQQGDLIHSSANRKRFARPGDPVIDSRDLYAVVLPA